MKKRWILVTAAAVIAVAGTFTALFWGGTDRQKEPFYGTHQSGITTAAQKFIFAAAFDVTATSTAELRNLLKGWTVLASALAEGRGMADSGSALAPPSDPGETLGYRPARLTFTFGAGASLFDRRFGLESQRPQALAPLPPFKGDNLNPAVSDGDLVVLVGADDLQTAYHGLHVLTRAAKGLAVLRWVQEGFQPGLEVNGPGPGRNLQGFIDGTSNPDPRNEADMNQVVWVTQGPDWLKGGSYVVVRRIRMFVEAWDRTALGDQEKTIGRNRSDGQEKGPQEADSHVALAKASGSQRIFRRPFHFVNGLDPRTGQWDAGLLFLAWVKDPAAQYIPMQRRISESDRLNEYVQPVGSALFAVFPGTAPGDYVGSTLVPEPPLAGQIQDVEAGIGSLYPVLASGDWARLKKEAKELQTPWQALVARAGSRASALEKRFQDWASAVDKGPSDPVQVKISQSALVKELELWEKASAPAPAPFGGTGNLLMAPLTETRSALDSQNWNQARVSFQNFEKAWAAQEAQVKAVDGNLYSRVEVLDGTIRRGLEKPPVTGETRERLGDLTQALGSLAPHQAYTAWDAGMILFREGLEALLVIAALLAFLRRSGQKKGVVWVWSGAGLGLGTSMGAALGLSVLLAGWTAAPELVEGVAGTAAVALMLTAGLWLHRKAAIKDWNQWIQAQMGRSAGRVWVLGFLAFLAVLREGGETVVFYAGMARSLGPGDLVLGLGAGLAVLGVLGFLILGLSKRLPLRVFFFTAEILIFYLAVKILGQSLTSLQSAGLLSATPLNFGSPVDVIGFSPTWETALPQGLLALGLGTLLVLTLTGFSTPKKSQGIPPGVKPS